MKRTLLLGSTLVATAMACMSGCASTSDSALDERQDQDEEITGEAAQAIGILMYSTYLGGAEWDTADAVTVDGAGNAYVVGRTIGTGKNDIFVAKYSPAGALMYEAILSGTSVASSTAIAVDPAGNAYVTAPTYAASPILVAKISAAGDALLYAAQFGGPQGSATPTGIAADAAGNAYVTGTTGSSSFPTTAGAFQTAFQGPTDAFVTKLNAAGNAFVYSTLLGGWGTEDSRGIAIDASGNAYVTGTTTPSYDVSSFPTTPGSFQPSAGGGSDAYVTKLNATGTGLVFSTFLGGQSNELAWGAGGRIAIDSATNVYVAGYSSSCDFPTTPGAYLTVHSGCANKYEKAFVTKLNAAGAGLVYSTYIDFWVESLAVDGAGNAHVGGDYAAKLNAAGSALLYRPDLSHSSHFYGVAADSAGNTYAAGWTGDTDFPMVAAAQPVFGGDGDAVVVKLNGNGGDVVYTEWNPSYWTNAYSDAAGWSSSEAYWGTIEYPDLDGDGKQDVCGRSSSGLSCALSNGSGFNTPSMWNYAFRDEQGWQLQEYLWGSIQYPDVNGDGKQDVCGRSSTGLRCGLSTGTSFYAPTSWSTAYSNAAHWYVPSWWKTIAFPDLDGNGKQDVCGRSSAGLRCALSNGNSFNTSSLWTSAYGDAQGWGSSEAYWGTIAFPDLDGDGKRDVCGRSSAGLRCALSNGSSFNASTLWTTAYGDADGWGSSEAYWGTIEYPDLDGDGKQDVCGRSGLGLLCALSNGSSFNAPSLWTTQYADAGGWSMSESSWGTIEYPDLDGDGKQDVCGRSGLGLFCALSNGSSFNAPTLWTTDYSDAQGWGTAEHSWGTIRYPDLDGDGKQDVCGRGPGGLFCAR